MSGTDCTDDAAAFSAVAAAAGAAATTAGAWSHLWDIHTLAVAVKLPAMV
jgi:hypothetical protein